MVTVRFFEMGCFLHSPPRAISSQHCPATEMCSEPGNSESFDSQSHNSAPGFPLPRSLSSEPLVSLKKCCSYSREEELQHRLSNNITSHALGSEMLSARRHSDPVAGKLGSALLLSHTADACVGREGDQLCDSFAPCVQRQKDAGQAPSCQPWHSFSCVSSRPCYWKTLP